MMQRTRIRARRPGIRRGQPTPRQVNEVRLAVYGRSGGYCELKLDPDCIPGVLPWKGPDAFSRGHLVHIRAKRRFGTSVQNCAWGCHPCHLVGLHNPKPCPPKPRIEVSLYGVRYLREAEHQKDAPTLFDAIAEVPA